MRVAYLLDHFPELTETFVSGEVHELVRLGHAVHVEAAARPPNPDADAARGIDVAYGDASWRDLAWLVARNPRGCARDLRSRRRWRREEPVRPLRAIAASARRIDAFGAQHLHAHFAAGAALDALRIGALLGIPYSVMTHGFDIFQRPRNLREKHARAKFAVTPCDYSARYLGSLGLRAQKLVMGVDELRRDRPHPTERVVVAVGRLVEKKGFVGLVEAAARLDARVVIVGEGPLRARLARTGSVELLGALPPAEVLAIIQRAAVLAMPCVVAADGDRDTMPLVVKEALALEVPVVASEEVGLPEVVRPGWGRLVAPGDAAALADALEELLALPVAERARMGAAGRAFVLEHCSRARETARLAELMAS